MDNSSVNSTLVRWDIIIPVLIAVLGWLANHKLTIRAQEKKFLNDIKNDARLKISEAIRDYQEWLMRLETYFNTLENTLNRPKFGMPINWKEEFERYIKITSPEPNSWNWLLEEYRILFPETAKVRVILQRRQFEISQIILWFSFEFWMQYSSNEQDNISSKFLILNEIKRWCDYISDQGCLVYDLRIYLQNCTLKEITGDTVPERKPLGNTVCKIVVGKDGNLEIVDETGNAVQHSKLPFSSHDIWAYPID